ncbi:hypothetical protein HanRHA438_Chr13g0581791 [Helianthus annuus]|nr:hypothetical protein HanIR_Chr13g0621421 [Helianthus annuus]KAJ0856731.1 hypothetical protein HanRHA438_Chr13g0581791 [Helianthus annuus]
MSNNQVCNLYLNSLLRKKQKSVPLPLSNNVSLLNLKITQPSCNYNVVNQKFLYSSQSE